MGLYSWGLIIGRICASEIWGGGLIFGRAYYRNFVVYLKAYLAYASVNSSCAIPPPGQLRGICTHCQSRGSRISLPKSYPRAFNTRGFWLEIQTKTILSEKTSSLSLIGLSVKDWTKLWRFLKVRFLDFRHFLIVYQATTLKRDRERSLWLCISRSKRMRRYPGVGHLLSSFIPTPGNLPPKTKKSANARGLAWGGGEEMGAAGIDWCSIK